MNSRTPSDNYGVAGPPRGPGHKESRFPEGVALRLFERAHAVHRETARGSLAVSRSDRYFSETQYSFFVERTKISPSLIAGVAEKSPSSLPNLLVASCLNSPSSENT